MNEIHNYLEQVRRQNRASEYASSIQQPGRELATMVVDAEDIAALALAIESCTPQQLARWIHHLISYDPVAFDDDRADLFNQDEDWRADDSTSE